MFVLETAAIVVLCEVVFVLVNSVGIVCGISFTSIVLWLVFLPLNERIKVESGWKVVESRPIKLETTQFIERQHQEVKTLVALVPAAYHRPHNPKGGNHRGGVCRSTPDDVRTSRI